MESIPTVFSNRVYRIAGIYLGLGGGGCLIALAVASTQAPSFWRAALVLVLAGPWFCAISWWGWRTFTTRLEISESEVLVRNPRRATVLRWSEIVAFDFGVSFLAGRCLLIRTTDGRSVACSAVAVSPRTKAQRERVLATIRELEVLRLARVAHPTDADLRSE